MELSFFLFLCIVSVISLLLKKCYDNSLSYYIKWLAIYLIFCWRRLTSEKPVVPTFASTKEDILEKPKEWTKEKPFRRDSMLIFAASQDVWLLVELARGRYNSATVRIRVQLGPNSPSYETSEQDSCARACEGWTTDCLSLQCLEPMRRWRLVFTGRLQCKEGKNQKAEFVKINLIWAAFCGPYYYTTDADATALTESLANQPFLHMQYNLDALGKGYEQWGSVWGTVNVGGNVTEVHAPSLRRHIWKLPSVKARVDLVGVAENGTLFSMCYNFASMSTQFGHARYADGRIEPLVGSSSIETPVLPEKFVRNFTSACHSHTAYVVRSPFQRWGALRYAFARCTLDLHQASCLVLSWDKGEQENLPQLPLLMHTLVQSDDMLVSVDSPVCGNPAMVGGKAASLMLLVETAKTILKNKVIVPPAFVLTVRAMELQAQTSQALTSSVKFLGLVSSGEEVGNLQEECHHVVNAWLTVPLFSDLLAALSERVQPSTCYAVRSSGVGEDSGETSAAGQNDTVLNCVGIDAVVAAVHKCWASLYTFQSVQYRRQAGLPIETLMGVVVQEMAEAEVAGVMFTRHPVSGDPSQLLITANYGLGETVVSGSVEPDTIIVNSEDPTHLFIESSTAGKKDKRIVASDKGGVKEELLPEELTDSICLSEPEVIALAQVGISLQHLFGWPRDIEWAIKKGTIYLLQCRPVTSLLTWSEDELKHELNSATLPGDGTTTANIGEVLPGCTSPLSQSTVVRCIDFTMIRSFLGVHHPLWYNNQRLINYHHHIFLNFYNTLLLGAKEKPNRMQKVIELAVCGHDISTPDIQKIAAARSTHQSLIQKLLDFGNIVKTALGSKSTAKKAQKIGEDFQMNCDGFTSSTTLYSYMSSSFSHLAEAFRLHAQVTFASTLWQVVLFAVLAEGNEELSQEHLQDIAKLLVGKQTALSAQIPSDIKELTKLIKLCKNWEESTSLSPQKFSAWLKENSPQAARVLEGMIERYKHRNIKELDVMTCTWGLDSSPLIAMVQTTLKSSNTTRNIRTESDSDIVQQLKSPKKPLTRKLIGWILGLSSSAAARREVTKDASLRVIHQMRCSYLRLARLMTEEGRLPSPGLIFYLTHYEIGQLLKGPDPSLIHKANRRQRSWKQWDGLQFQEVTTTLPIPVQFSSHPLLLNSEAVQGTLVCTGTARGRACVLLSCSDAHILQEGDILITHSTDVGWTPLFPLLAGVVTELGGLISHGAVVAREYGLPCVVGATNATLVFKTGDEIYLDGQTGLVQKVSSA